MPVLIVKTENGDHQIPFHSGQSLRDILNETDLQLRSACRGIGACGLCRVRIEAGAVDDPSTNERIYLDIKQIDQGVRLACQIIPRHDLTITLLNPIKQSKWRNLPARPHRQTPYRPALPPSALLPDIKNPLCVAVDLGTTHISISLHDLSCGSWLAGRYGLNPQINTGSDVMTRLAAATESPCQARDLQHQLIQAIREALLDIASREGINLHQVVRITLVGNTAMLCLLSGRNYHLLIQPSYWMQAIDCLPEDTRTWAALWDIHSEATIELMPPIAGFVGSDVMAGVLATRLIESEGINLFVDFGTNSEIALWDGRVLWVTSAAGGPAFEGSGISCGMPAEPGAIFQISLTDGKSPNYSVIAGRTACGLCGSGMVDLIAGLVKLGTLSSTGRFAPGCEPCGFLVVDHGQAITLTKSDVDLFQRAKAAVAAGIQVLMTNAGISGKDLHSIKLGGAFGHLLNVENALHIGLLPNVSPERVELCGNTALEGCEQILLSANGQERFKDIMGRARLINLAQCPDFDEFFFENLYLQPMDCIL